MITKPRPTSPNCSRPALIGEAEDLARGIRHLSVVTGEFETADDVQRVEQLTAVAWGGCDDARMTHSRGGNDYVTSFIEGPAADAFVDDFVALAESSTPGGGRPSAHHTLLRLAPVPRGAGCITGRSRDDLTNITEADPRCLPLGEVIRYSPRLSAAAVPHTWRTSSRR